MLGPAGKATEAWSSMTQDRVLETFQPIKGGCLRERKRVPLVMEHSLGRNAPLAFYGALSRYWTPKANLWFALQRTGQSIRPPGVPLDLGWALGTPYKSSAIWGGPPSSTLNSVHLSRRCSSSHPHRLTSPLHQATQHKYRSKH